MEQIVDACDDPYKILALNLMSSCSDTELTRIMHDVKAIKRHIAREVKNVDFCGYFLDCLMVDLVKTGRHRSIGTTMEKTVDFFYNELDVPRLRKELKMYCDKYGRELN